MTNTTTSGTKISISSNATNGVVATANVSGLYCINYTDYDGAGLPRVGISRNSSELTTDILSLTTLADRLTTATAGASGVAECSITVRLNAGDVIRPHGDGSNTGTSNWTRFTMEYLGA